MTTCACVPLPDDTCACPPQAAEHLAFARELAADRDGGLILEKDHAYGREHRKTGLPDVLTPLELDMAKLEEHGLIHPQELIEAVQRARAAASSEAVSPALVAMDSTADGGAPPHYMQSTKSFEIQACPASPSSRDDKTTLSSGDGRDLVSLCSVVGVGTD